VTHKTLGRPACRPDLKVSAYVASTTVEIKMLIETYYEGVEIHREEKIIY
jgi:hypothetical protein